MAVAERRFRRGGPRGGGVAIESPEGLARERAGGDGPTSRGKLALAAARHCARADADNTIGTDNTNDDPTVGGWGGQRRADLPGAPLPIDILGKFGEAAHASSRRSWDSIAVYGSGERQSTRGRRHWAALARAAGRRNARGARGFHATLRRSRRRHVPA